jgi:cobalt-zinc-cadmium efflux system protein
MPHGVNRIKIVLLLTSSYLVAAIVIVLLPGSLALLSEAGHMIADVGGLALALFAINYTLRPATPKRTYGFYRLEILASLVNSVVLVMLSIYIVYEALRRIFEPPEIQGFPLIIAAIVGIVVNFIGMRMLSGSSKGAGQKAWHHHGHKHYEAVKEEQRSHYEESLNIKAVYLETLSDTLGTTGVVAAGVIILTTKFYLADPIISIGLALFMIPRTWSIIKKAIHILMEGSPATVPHDIVKNSILQIKGVTGVFDLDV